MHRSGELEAFAHRLTEMGKGLTLQTFSETRLALLRDTLESMGNSEERIMQRLRIAAVLEELARWKESEEQQRRALAEATALANAKIVAVVSNDLAALLLNTNRLGEAEPLMRRALEINESAFGNQHPTVAICLNNLATLLQATSRREEAEPLMWRALEINEVAFGEQHPAVANRLDNLAQMLQETDRNREAEPLMLRALEIDEDAFGLQHPTVALRLNNLAILLRDTNRIEEAEPLMRRALDIFDAFGRQTGHEHPYFRRANEIYHAIQRAMDSDESD